MAKLAVCEGEVVTVDGKRSSIDWYTEEFVMSDSVDTIAKARSMLQAGLVAERLRQKVEGFKRVRTCQVVSLDATEQKAESTELDDLLLEAISLSCVPEQIDRYKTADSKIRALKKAIDGHKERKKKEKKKETVTDEGFVD
jgi:hypothetical protein